MRRPPLTTIAIALPAVGAVVAAVLVVGGSPARSSTQERTVTVALGVVQSTVSGSGNLSPANQRDLDFDTSGTVTKVYVHEGEHVGEEQLLAKIDDSAAKVDLAQATSRSCSAYSSYG